MSFLTTRGRLAVNLGFESAKVCDEAFFSESITPVDEILALWHEKVKSATNWLSFYHNIFLFTGTLSVVRSLNESNQDETEKFLIYFSVVVAVCALCVVVTLTGLIWAIQKKSNSEENVKENFSSDSETE